MMSDTAYGSLQTNTAVVVEATEKLAIGRSATELYIRDYFNHDSIMIDIARCESGFLQFDSTGEVVKNPTSTARGAFQIMSSLHREAALQLGYDIMTLEGNVGFAEHLYETQGTRPWNASAHCWGSVLAMR